MKRLQSVVIAGLLLLMAIMPLAAQADSPTNSISLSPDSGRPGDLIEATVSVSIPGRYYICWGSRTEANIVGIFTATMAGERTVPFHIREVAKGPHDVFLTTETYDELAKATFVVYPTVKIDPTEGPVGTQVSIEGYGFTANQSIRIVFNDTVAQTATADANGSWTASYAIPPSPGGTRVLDIEVQEGAAWVGWMSRSFRVLPAITVTPISGKVGQPIQVSGTGFAGDERGIQVTFDGEVVKKDIPANANGSWDAVVTVPPRQSGPTIIGASGQWTRARNVPPVEFIVQAGILVAPSSAYAGDTVTVTGGGFLPAETGITVTYRGQTPASGITADRYGAWETSFTLPASPYGDNAVTAHGDATAAVTGTVNIRARLDSISPVEGAPGDSVTITGTGFGSNQRLTVLFDGNLSPTEVRTRDNGDVVVTVRVPATIIGTQTVVVRDDSGASDSFTFRVTEKTLDAPAPMLPEDESRTRPGDITFRWGGITGEGITYTLEISNEPGNVVWSRSGIEERQYEVPKEELPQGTYYWRVKAVDGFRNESEWSSRISFRVYAVPIWVWVVVGLVVLVVLMVVAYRETRFRVVE
ncbi:MAG: IPT/TIG domain-containing protein [Dehalococcoidia bacterium]|nr:IPT/TIG domain-containing protein [Dehalococcoidia bacterium]